MRSTTKTSEHQEQVYLFEWAKLNSKKYPVLSLLFAVPNGGQRHKLVAAKLKREGVKSGVPDMFLPVARNEFNGLFIELKRADGGSGASKKQKAWLDELNHQGYLAIVCNGWSDARKQIEKYLGIGGI